MENVCYNMCGLKVLVQHGKMLMGLGVRRAQRRRKEEKGGVRKGNGEVESECGAQKISCPNFI